MIMWSIKNWVMLVEFFFMISFRGYKINDGY